MGQPSSLIVLMIVAMLWLLGEFAMFAAGIKLFANLALAVLGHDIDLSRSAHVD